MVSNPGGRGRHVSPRVLLPPGLPLFKKLSHYVSFRHHCCYNVRVSRTFLKVLKSDYSPPKWSLKLVDTCVCMLYVCPYMSVTPFKYQSSAQLPVSSQSPSFSSTYLSASVNVRKEVEGARSYFGIQLFFPADVHNCFRAPCGLCVWLGVLVPLSEKSQCGAEGNCEWVSSDWKLCILCIYRTETLRVRIELNGSHECAVYAHE